MRILKKPYSGVKREMRYHGMTFARVVSSLA